jgi:RNA polymerase sigma-70 factor (ECF subfamily)
MILGSHPVSSTVEKLHATGLVMSEARSSIEAQSLDFESIYDTWFHEVCRWMRALGGFDADLDDLAQEVFLVVRRKLPEFDGQNLRAWLYGIAQRTVSNYRRAAWYRSFWKRKKNDEPQLSLHALVDPSRGPIEELERRDAERILSVVLRSMKEKHRTAFILFAIEGYSGEEIAELEGVPVNTIWTRLFQARKEFKRSLERVQSEARQT